MYICTYILIYAHIYKQLEDASAELMMTTDAEGKVMLLIGEAFIQTSEEDATECTFWSYIYDYMHLFVYT